MPTPASPTMRRALIAGCVAALSTAMIGTATVQPAASGIREASYQVRMVASIVESTATVGISDNLYLLADPADIAKSLDMMKSLGISNVRVAVPWVGIQSTDAATYDWTKMDAIVDAADARGMGVLGVLTGTPGWAGEYMTGHSDPTAFAAFAGTVAAHYGSKISAYEIWNEPNSTWAYDPVDPAAYTEMLKAGYTAIKNATNGAAEVIGGVVGAGLTDGTSALDPVSFVTQMYAAGAHGYFDALSFHPYSPVKFSEGPAYFPGVSALDQVTAIRSLMNANGDAARKIWLSEYGAPTDRVTEQQQAAMIQDLVRYWQHVAGGGPIFLYNTRDTSPNPEEDPDSNNFGLYHYDWTPKAAAAIVKSLIDSLKTPTIPTNPIAAFFAAMQRAFSSAVNAFTAGIASVVNAFTGGIQNFFNALASIFRPRGAAAVAPPRVAPAALSAVTSTGKAEPAQVAAASAPGSDTPRTSVTLRRDDLRLAKNARPDTPRGRDHVRKAKAAKSAAATSAKQSGTRHHRR